VDGLYGAVGILRLSSGTVPQRIEWLLTEPITAARFRYKLW
jgi:hypothetical protein